MVDNSLRSSKSKHINVWWYIIRDLVKTKAIIVMHVESGRQRIDILRKVLSISLLKRLRKGLMNLRDSK